MLGLGFLRRKANEKATAPVPNQEPDLTAAIAAQWGPLLRTQEFQAA